MWSYSPFCPKFRSHCNEGQSGKNSIGSIWFPSTKPPFRRKNLANISYTRRVIANFVPNFVAMATGFDGQKCGWQHSMAHPRKSLYRCKNLADIFDTSQVMINFVPNFVAMATGVGRGKMQLAAFDGPSPKTSLKAQKSRKNSLRKPSYSHFCPKFRCHGNGGRSGKNAIGSIRWPIPENLPIDAKISQKSLTQAKLYPILSQISLPWQPGRVRGKIR